MILRCDCTAESLRRTRRATNALEFQNKKYGSGLRVYNKMKDGVKSRCTVCGKEK